MSVDLSTFVKMFDQQLVTVGHLLDKGEAANGEAILDWRLAEDMHPLRFQLRTLANLTGGWLSRVVGQEPPVEIGDDLDLAGFRAALADARALLATLTHDRFAARDDVPLTVTLGNGLAPTLPSGQWLTGFATTNVYFHLSMVYAILRARGVQLGKADMFAAGL